MCEKVGLQEDWVVAYDGFKKRSCEPVSPVLHLWMGSGRLVTVRRWWIWVIFPGLVALAVVSLGWGARAALLDSADLLRRAEEVQLFLKQMNPYADPDCTYPPSAMPVFAGLVGPWSESALPAVYLGLNLLALAGLMAWVANESGRGWRDPSTWCLLAWCVACRPVRAGLALGQFHIIPITLALWATVSLTTGRQYVAGVLLGLALIKPTMVYPIVLVWAFTGYWRSLATALAIQAALTIGCSLWLGVPIWDLTHDWMVNARGQMNAGTLDLPTLVGTIWAGERARLAATVLMLGLSTVLLWNARKGRIIDQTALALALAAFGTYHRHYDLGLLMPAVVVLLRPQVPGERQSWNLQSYLPLGLAALLIVPTNPAWIKRHEAWVDALVAGLSYAVAWLVYRRCVLCANAEASGTEQSLA